MRHAVISNSKISSEIYPILLIYMLLEILNVLLHHLLHSKSVFFFSFYVFILGPFQMWRIQYNFTHLEWFYVRYVCTVNYCLPTV